MKSAGKAAGDTGQSEDLLALEAVLHFFPGLSMSGQHFSVVKSCAAV
jgi:hypothetical protein